MTFKDVVDKLNQIDMLQTNTYCADMTLMIEVAVASLTSAATTTVCAEIVEMIRDQGKTWSRGEMLYVAHRCESMELMSALIADKYRKVIDEQSR